MRNIVSTLGLLGLAVLIAWRATNNAPPPVPWGQYAPVDSTRPQLRVNLSPRSQTQSHQRSRPSPHRPRPLPEVAAKPLRPELAGAAHGGAPIPSATTPPQPVDPMVQRVGFQQTLLASTGAMSNVNVHLKLVADEQEVFSVPEGNTSPLPVNLGVFSVRVTLGSLDPRLVRLSIDNGPELPPVEPEGTPVTTFNFRTGHLDGVRRLNIRHYKRRDVATNVAEIAKVYSYVIDVNSRPLTAIARLEQVGNRLLTIELSSPLNASLQKEKNWAQYFLLLELNDQFGIVDETANLLSAATLQGQTTLVFQLPALTAGKHYRLLARTGVDGITDLYGNQLSPNGDNGLLHLSEIFIPEAQPAIVAPGLRNPAGPYVKYHEYTPPREQPDGFNPSDKVESRVVRLYFYRDAHRVAQIINRNVRSYNQGGVEAAHQAADEAREKADELRLERQRQERAAVVAAQETRRKEREADQAEEQLSRAVRELTTARLQANRASDAATAAQLRADDAADALTEAADEADQKIAKDRQKEAQAEQDAAEAKQQTQEGIESQLESVVERLSGKVDLARQQVEEARSKEIAANELALQLQAREELAAQNQFRREVAAANEDPATYAPGVPQSYDPVQQVSVAVIGEGLIHLRGPLKGINIIRQMIDRIDTPVGQVRVQVHTVNINGERGERIERAATKAELHIEQARFLTMQSCELLRRAVVEVASRKAEEARAFHPGERQADRDFRYLDAFFGRDFIRELESIDSEFLRTGNKLLSLHSMDTTSLSSALTLMALAKNSTRQEILQQFEAYMHSELPSAEERFLQPRLTNCGRRCCLGCICRHHHPKICLLAGNASFQSIRGFFAAEIAHDDTMTPMQREFIRLAQIFKSRLVTELEYKQRVMERSIIEERIQTDYLGRLQQAFAKERAAEMVVEGKQVARVESIGDIKMDFKKLVAKLVDVKNEGVRKREALRPFREWAENAKLHYNDNARMEMAVGDARIKVAHDFLKNAKTNQPLGDRYFVDEDADPATREQHAKLMLGNLRAVQSHLRKIYGDTLNKFSYTEDLDTFFRVKELQTQLDFSNEKARSRYLQEGVPAEQVKLLIEGLDKTLYLLGKVEVAVTELTAETHRVELLLSSPDTDPDKAYMAWRGLYQHVMSSLWRDGEPSDLQIEAKAILDDVEESVVKLLQSIVDLEISTSKAELARRPLDQKKFLDMLVDDLEEKYIELLEGTRAHTANIDNYIKRLTTALDDDLNNQFYEPAFQQVRAAGRKWDVQFGQIESTGVLANNRAFAKVVPKATMEFDLPERKALFVEGIDAAKAIMDDAGALVNDPAFLAAATGASGMSVATMPRGSAQGMGVVRDVLPGLKSSSAEHVMAHNRATTNQFGSNLENLIPDPAIYKFETGTGYEIRPVIQPDGQAVVFDFHYLYTTEVREPVRADEKHLGRVRRQYIDTDVQLSNFELRKVSRYQVALKASRTGRGVPLLEDVPVLGVLFRPLPQQESSLQQNIVLAQATIFPTLFDLMGLRWAPAVADLDPLRLSNEEFVVRQRHRHLKNQVYDETSSQIDRFLRIPEAARRSDLYRTQETLPRVHPNGYRGDGLNQEHSQLQEGYQVEEAQAAPHFAPGASPEGSPLLRSKRHQSLEGLPYSPNPLETIESMEPEVEIESQAIPLSTPQGHSVTPTSYHRRLPQGARGTHSAAVELQRVRTGEGHSHASRFPTGTTTYQGVTPNSLPSNNAAVRPVQPTYAPPRAPAYVPRPADPRSVQYDSHRAPVPLNPYTRR